MFRQRPLVAGLSGLSGLSVLLSLLRIFKEVFDWLSLPLSANQLSFHCDVYSGEDASRYEEPASIRQPVE